MFVLTDPDLLGKMTTNEGETITELSTIKPVMLVFLRHLGCMFCKEALSDLKNLYNKITDLGTAIVLVHMATEEEASAFFHQFELSGIQHISDIEKKYYSSFGLDSGDFAQLFGFTSFLGMGRAMSKGIIPTKSVGDPHQMPGIFLINKSQIVKSFLFKSVGQRPDYLALASPN